MTLMGVGEKELETLFKVKLQGWYAHLNTVPGFPLSLARLPEIFPTHPKSKSKSPRPGKR